MTSYLPMIRRAQPADLDAMAFLLTEAFLHGDLAPWLIPNVNTRSRIYPPYFALLMQHALAYGHVDIIDEQAVAVWYAIGEQPLPDIQDYTTKLAMIVGEHLHRFEALDAAMHAHHPRDAPHHYLAFIGVIPEQQGSGLGSALLDHHHAACDDTGAPAYLEATGTRNRALYARHGYRPRPAYRITTGGPSLYPLLRRPTPPRHPTADPGARSPGA